MKNKIANSISKLRLALLAAALVGIGTDLALSRRSHAREGGKAAIHLAVNDTAVQRDGKYTTSFAPVVKRVAPSVVKVFTSSSVKATQNMPMLDDPFFRRFFGGNDELQPGRNQRRPQKQHGLGSGVIVTRDGYILTNNHVVENADEVKVALSEGNEEFTAKVVGRDPKTDIAVLKIDAGKDLPYIEVTNSDKIEVGDLVLAVGNPFGIGQTVTMGMVSATGRATLGMDYEDFIQTDAAINPGNSGGALVDTEGRLVGINTAILSQSGGNQGIGFAVPINLARSVMESLVKNGRVVRGFLGVNIQDMDQALASEFKLKDSHGALVSTVNPNTPAAKAGLQSGDVIVQFNNKDVMDSRQLKLQVAQIAPGTKVPVKIIRDGATKTLEVTLKELPRQELAGKTERNSQKEDDLLDGVTVGDIDTMAKNQLKVPANVKGALITQIDPGSPAYQAGLREGDIIQEINRQTVTNADEAVALSDKIKSGSILLRVWSNRGGSHFVVVKEPKIG